MFPALLSKVKTYSIQLRNLFLPNTYHTTFPQYLFPTLTDPFPMPLYPLLKAHQNPILKFNR